ncbi:permease [Candidatus Parcubacteria bacterium]|nr:MAG: permease [Candidatus Parcubacteria bacterium]
MDIFSPIQTLADYLTYNLFNIAHETALAHSVNFFIYDLLKIFILLIVVTHLMSLVRHYLPTKKFQAFLTSRKFYGLDHVIASLFGALTPFCSCSSIPLFINFLRAGIPLGVVFSFLITSPLINEIAIALFIGLFGWKVTLVYIISGLAIGIIGGMILGRLKMEKYVIDLDEAEKKCCCCKKQKPTFNQILIKVSKEAFDITKKISLYLIAGVAIGSLIHGYVPQGFFETYLQIAGIWAVPLAVILAVPLYSNASGTIPVIQSLIAKGVPIGTGLAFMMAIVGLSLPEAMILKRVLRLPLLAAFFGIVTVGIIMIGYLINFVF